MDVVVDGSSRGRRLGRRYFGFQKPLGGSIGFSAGQQSQGVWWLIFPKTSKGSRLRIKLLLMIPIFVRGEKKRWGSARGGGSSIVWYDTIVPSSTLALIFLCVLSHFTSLK